jgi:hypothetical protein
VFAEEKTLSQLLWNQRMMIARIAPQPVHNIANPLVFNRIRRAYPVDKNRYKPLKTKHLNS